MQQLHIHQVPILAQPDKHHKAGDLAGVVILNKIITRELDITKATAKSLIMSTTKLAPDDTLDRAAELIIGSNQRAIPVWDGELVGILSEEDLMKAVGVEGKARDIAKPCVCVEDTAGIGKVKELMVYKNISRVGVTKVGKPNELVGIVGTMDLAKALAPGSRGPHGAGGFATTGKVGSEIRGQRDRGYMESTQLDKTTVMNFIHSSPMIDGGDEANKAVELLRSNEEVIVKLDGGLIGIITPKDVLRAYLSGRSVALVQIVGLDREDDVLDVARIQQKAAQIIQHLASSVELQPMKIYIKQHRKQGPKIKYSVKIELPTSIGNFIANLTHGKSDKSYGDLTTLVQSALDDIEREARKAQEKFRKPDRAWVSEMRSEKEEGIGLRSRRIRKG
jgi:CBS domain-containing protein/ribosome-associated translation inhibitor RaiA